MAGNRGLRPTPRGRAGERGEKPGRAGRGRAGGAGPARAPKVKAPKPPKTKAPKTARPATARATSRTRAEAASEPRRPRISLPRAQRRASAAQAPAERRQRHQRAQVARVVLIVVGALAALAVVALVALFALRDTPVFRITSIEFEPTEHISGDDVQNLARVPEGSTLLNVDTDAIEAELRKNPWVGSVSFGRVFPNTLKITIAEQRPDLLVVMSSGSMAWYLGDAGTWIEPVPIQAAEGQSVTDAVLAVARENGCVLVTDVPSTVDPMAGAPATDEVLDAVRQFREGFSQDFASQVVCYSAPSPENVSCVLANGVEVSLGSVDQIAAKQSIVEAYLEQYPGSVVRINVRVPSSPSFRQISSDNVQAGEGVSVSEGADAETGGDANADASADAAADGTDAASDAPADASDPAADAA